MPLSTALVSDQKEVFTGNLTNPYSNSDWYKSHPFCHFWESVAKWVFTSAAFPWKNNTGREHKGCTVSWPPQVFFWVWKVQNKTKMPQKQTALSKALVHVLGSSILGWWSQRHSKLDWTGSWANWCNWTCFVQMLGYTTSMGISQPTWLYNWTTIYSLLSFISSGIQCSTLNDPFLLWWTSASGRTQNMIRMFLHVWLRIFHVWAADAITWVEQTQIWWCC